MQFRFTKRLMEAAFVSSMLAGIAASAQPTVSITQIVEHPALDAMRRGVIDGLQEHGFADGKQIKVNFQSAQGSPVTAGQIAQKFAGDSPAVIVALSTPSAQTVVAANKVVPVVFGAVTDPIGTRLVQNLERPGANVTGMTAFPPLPQLFELLSQIMPSARRIGVIYNAGEANSVAVVTAMKAHAKSKQLEIVDTTVTRTAEVGAAAEFLVGKIDALMIPGDNTVFSSMEAVFRVTQAHKLPTVCADPTAAARGCVAALGYDWYGGGKELSERIAQILKGKPPGSIPVEGAKRVTLVLNQKSADAIGVRFPEAVSRRAESTVK